MCIRDRPMDQGVIKNFEVHYRKYVLQSVVVNMQQCQSVDELVKKISVLGAIRWICSAFNDISQTCVKKCFWKSGIKRNTEKKIWDQKKKTPSLAYAP